MSIFMGVRVLILTCPCCIGSQLTKHFLHILDSLLCLLQFITETRQGDDATHLSQKFDELNKTFPAEVLRTKVCVGDVELSMVVCACVCSWLASGELCIECSAYMLRTPT